MRNLNLYKLIKEYSSNPPVDIEGLILSLGLELDINAELPKEISGIIQLLPNGNYKISVNKEHHDFRKRFTMAHELGHYLLHKSLIGEHIGDDRLYRTTNAGKYSNPYISSQNETQANKFAAELLMPFEEVEMTFKEQNHDIRKVAGIWKVSPGALRIRLNLPQPKSIQRSQQIPVQAAFSQRSEPITPTYNKEKTAPISKEEDIEKSYPTSAEIKSRE